MSIEISTKFIEKHLSNQRFAHYILISNNDLIKAFALYELNIDLSKEFFEALNWVEVCIRNNINSALVKHHGEDWYNSSFIQTEKDKDAVAKAKQLLEVSKKPITNSNITAELNFGFWVNLFNHHNEENWRKIFRRIFQGAKLTRQDVSRKLQSARKIRNRIAHHEIILNQNLEKQHNNLLDILSLIDPQLAKYVSSRTKILALLNKLA